MKLILHLTIILISRTLQYNEFLNEMILKTIMDHFQDEKEITLMKIDKIKFLDASIITSNTKSIRLQFQKTFGIEKILPMDLILVFKLEDQFMQITFKDDNLSSNVDEFIFTKEAGHLEFEKNSDCFMAFLSLKVLKYLLDIDTLSSYQLKALTFESFRQIIEQNKLELSRAKWG